LIDDEIFCLLSITGIAIYFHGLILKANLSWTRKNSNSSDAKILSLFVSCFFALKAGLQVPVLLVWVLSD